MRARRGGGDRSARARPRPPATSASTSSSLLADDREHGAVVVGVRVDVEQARVRAASAAPIASIVAGSRPSEKFGTDSSGSTRLLYEPTRCVRWSAMRLTGHRPATAPPSGACSGSCAPYRVSLLVSVVLAIASQAGSLAFPWLTGQRRRRDRRRRPEPRLPRLIGDRARRRRRARRARTRRPPADLRQAGARGRARPAERALREARPALVRLLRPPPDGAADVARDRRPAERPLLPRLRADLLLPARLHRRRRRRSSCSSSRGSSR